MREAPGRMPYAVRAAISMGVPVLIGVLAGDPPAGLMAVLGAFTALYGSGRPYVYRALMLGLVAVGLALAVGLGLEASRNHYVALLTVSAIAMAATLLCRALNTGPPGAYLFALACAAGTAMPASHLSPWHAAALVLAGGAFSWIAHMVGALFRPRDPEKNAVLLAARAVGAFIRSLGTAGQDAARHRAALALTEAWSALVTYQPLQRRTESTIGRLRAINRELHLLFADAMSFAARGEKMPASAIDEVKRIANLARHPESVVPAHRDEIPLGRLRAFESLREAVKPGSVSLLVTMRVGVASLLAGLVGGLMGLERAYWAIAAAVLVLHFGFDWRRTVQRGLERMVGTWVGVLLAGAILALRPEGLWLVAAIMVVQFVLQMLVLRNYAFAVIFISVIALLISSGGRPVTDIGELMWARGIDTTLGCVVGIVVFALLMPRAAVARVRNELAATIDLVAPVLRHVERRAVTTPQARGDRRRLQHRLFALNEAVEGGMGGRAREREETEQMWPAIAAAQRLAYRVLAECWAIERGEPVEPLDAPGAQALAAQLAGLAAAVGERRKPGPLAPMPPLLAEEVRQLHATLTREPT